MSRKLDNLRRANDLPHSVGVLSCPCCGGTVQTGVARCPSCNFTGADSMEIFTTAPPPLLPILDAAGIFSAASLSKIEAAMKRLTYRYPQFQWRVVTAALPSDVNLPMFGFWLLNAAELGEQETAKQRAWTVLLVVDVTSGQASVATGYAAEPYISDESWKVVLAEMAVPWAAGKPVRGMIRFFKSSQRQLGLARKRYHTVSAARRSA